LRDFNDLSGNSDRNSWCIGRAQIDLEKMRLIAPSEKPIIDAANLDNSDIAFVADPFRIVVNDAIYIFTEAWSRSAQRGQIAVFTMNSCGHVVDWSVVLAEPFHLSYPCVFKQGAEYYMLPEAWESGQLLLYKAKTFPWCWERFKTLLELDYADPQIFYHNGAWYIFLNTDPLTNATASVFWTESLLGKWHPHPQNPMFSNDSIRSRSAGPLINSCGRIFRFSQDCRRQYGHCVFASEIVELSPSSICTTPARQVALDRPTWAGGAFHHMDVFLENGVHHALFDGYASSFDPQAK
jgi:hypothetical protein